MLLVIASSWHFRRSTLLHGPRFSLERYTQPSVLPWQSQRNQMVLLSTTTLGRGHLTKTEKQGEISYLCLFYLVTLEVSPPSNMTWNMKPIYPELPSRGPQASLRFWPKPGTSVLQVVTQMPCLTMVAPHIICVYLYESNVSTLFLLFQ